MYQFNRPYIRDTFRYFTPVYMPGETYSFYMNVDELLDDVDAFLPNAFQLWIINPDGSQNTFICNTLTLTLAGAVGYIIYVDNFNFPYIQDGEYFFQLYDTYIGSEKARSNTILSSSNSNTLYTTTLVSFRHNDQLFGIRYDLLPDFWQKFRLPINQIDAIDPRSVRDQYRESSNGRELRNAKSFRDIYVKLEFYWADDDDYEAVSAMLEHNNIVIGGNKIIDMTQVKVEKPNSFSKLSKGTFEVIVDQFQISREWDFVAVGSYTDYDIVRAD